MSAKSTAQIDAKREEFRKYLEKEGVLEKLTKALVALYEEPEKPSDALSFVRNNFAASELHTLRAQLDNMTKENGQLKSENGQLQTKVASLETENTELRKRVEELESKPKLEEPVKIASPALEKKEVEMAQSPVPMAADISATSEALPESDMDKVSPVDQQDPAPEAQQAKEEPEAKDAPVETELTDEPPKEPTDSMETDAPEGDEASASAADEA